MFLLLRPGPMPPWLPVGLTFDKPSPKQSARIGCWVVGWQRGRTLHLRPLFGGDVIVVESGGASVDVAGRANEITIEERAFLPIGMPGSPLRVTLNGQTVFD